MNKNIIRRIERLERLAVEAKAKAEELKHNNTATAVFENGNDVKRKLTEMGLTQWRLAAKMGVREESLSRKLRGEITPEESEKIHEAITQIAIEEWG